MRKIILIKEVNSFDTDYLIFWVITFIIGIILIFYLDFKRLYPSYIIFILVVGLLNSYITVILIKIGYLVFPLRPLSDYVYNNVIYDMFLLPSFLLIVIAYSIRSKRFIWPMVVFVSFTVFQDYLAVTYSSLLLFKKWNLIHTFIGANISYLISFYLFKWLRKSFIKRGVY